MAQSSSRRTGAKKPAAKRTSAAKPAAKRASANKTSTSKTSTAKASAQRATSGSTRPVRSATSARPARSARSTRSAGKGRGGTAQRQTLLILGASGDLTGRLLLPGLGSLLASDHGTPLKLIGSGMEDWSASKWDSRVRKAFADYSGPLVRAAAADTEYVQADVTDAEQLAALLAKSEGSTAIYFALPPAVTAKVCQTLATMELPAGLRLVLEKPFGTDVSSAEKLNALLQKVVPEEQIFRVDHFLGKSTVLNILGLRFANRLLEPVLNAEHVEKIEIIIDEALGLEGRAGYYDGAGALVDMIQSHLLQVMSVLMMDAPPTLTAPDLRDRKSEVLRATKIWNDDPVGSSHRARYTAGSVGRRTFPAYAQSPGVDPSRKTETLAEITVEVDTWRWAGVPVTLRSGKALGTGNKQIIVTFKPPPRVPDGFTGTWIPERLFIGIDPAFMTLNLNVNGPGNYLEIDPAVMTADFGPGQLSPYGEVISSVLSGDTSLAVRGDAAVDCWRVVQPVLNAWKADKVPLDTYPAGSAGPKSWPTVGAKPISEPLL